MSPRRSLLVVLATALAALSCASEPPTRSPLLVEPDPFLATERSGGAARFCIGRIEQDLGLDAEDARLLDFQERIIRSLQAAGFETVGADRVEEVWDRAVATAEPAFDPYTGQRDHDRARRAHLAAAQALGTELGCHFRVSPSLVQVSTWWHQGKARWDGQEASLGWRGSNRYGTIGAVSLHLRIADLEDEPVYFGTGGIQLTAGLGGESVWKDEFVPIEPARLLADPERNQEAIDLALAGIRSPQ